MAGRIKLTEIRSKYSSLPVPAKAAVWFTVCNILVRGISFLSAPVFTRLLSDDEYGQLSLYTSSESILLVLACWDVSYGAYQKGLFKYADDIVFFKGTIQLFTTLTALFSFIITIIAYKPLAALIIIPRRFLWIIMIFAIFQTAYQNWLVGQQTRYAYKSAVFLTVLYSLLRVAAPMVGIMWYRATANVKFIFQLLASISVCVFFYLPNIHYGRLFKEVGKLKEQVCFIIRFQLPCVIHSLSLIILAQADRIMIGKMVGTTSAAYYSVAYNLASAVQVITASLGQVLYPWTYQMMEQKKYGYIRKYTNYILMFLAGLLLLFVLIAPEIVNVLFPYSYHEAIACIPPITLSIFFTFLYGRFSCIEAYFEKTQYLMYVSVVCSSINIILNYIGICSFGYVACAYTTLISYILSAMGHYFIMDRICQKKGVKRLISIKFVSLFSLAFLSVGIVIQVMFGNIWLRYGCMLIIILVVALNRKKILAFINMIKISDVSK